MSSNIVQLDLAETDCETATVTTIDVNIITQIGGNFSGLVVDVITRRGNRSA